MNCCGASGPADYRHSAWFNLSRPVEEVFVPSSCCVTDDDDDDDVRRPSTSNDNDDRRRDAALSPPAPRGPSRPHDQDSCQLNAILFPNHDKSSRSLRTQVPPTDI